MISKLGCHFFLTYICIYSYYSVLTDIKSAAR